MASSTDNVKLGVCTLTYGTATPVDLGYTKGGVEVSVTTETYKVMVDQFGNSEINERIIGRTISVVTPLAETTLENLVQIMPGATLTTDGVDPTKKKVEVTHGIGTNLLTIADKLVLHPFDLDVSDVSEDFTIPKAATAGQMTFAYRLDEERVYNCTWTGYPDTDNGNVLFIYGDPTATA